jgi:hypothetical protein
VNRFIMSSMRHKVSSALQFIGGGISRAATSAIFVGFILVIAGMTPGQGRRSLSGEAAVIFEIDLVQSQFNNRGACGHRFVIVD